MVSSKQPEASRVRLAMLLRSSMAVDVSFIVDEAIGAVKLQVRRLPVFAIWHCIKYHSVV